MTEWRGYMKEAKGHPGKVPSPQNLERAKNKVVKILNNIPDYNQGPQAVLEALARMKNGQNWEYSEMRRKNSYRRILVAFEKRLDELMEGRSVIVKSYAQRDPEKGMVKVEELVGRQGKIEEIVYYSSFGRPSRPIFYIKWLGDDEIAQNLNHSKAFSGVKLGEWKSSNLMSSLHLEVEDPITIEEVAKIFGSIKKI